MNLSELLLGLILVVVCLIYNAVKDKK